MEKSNKLEILFIFIVFILLFILIVNTPLIYKYKNKGELIINEVMASNKRDYVSLSGKYYDYIELYNGYDYDINLGDYYLSDDNFNLRKWKFPDVVILSKSYLLIYASGKDFYDDDEIHTNFKISKSGEVLTLSNKKAEPLSRIFFEETKSDTSYGYNGSSYVYYYVPTPGYINNTDYSNEPIKEEKSNIKLLINEYSKGINSQIELYNGEDYDINLENYYLSNDSKDPYKYILPNITIKSNDYLVINTNGENNKNGFIDANFSLDYDDDLLILTNDKREVVHKVYLKPLSPVMSAGYYDNTWYIYKESSFGSVNKDNYTDTFSDIIKNVVINEVSTTQIELKNISDDVVDLSIYSLSDKSGAVKNLSGYSIKPNGYITFNTNYLGFGINNGNEKITLYESSKKIDEYQVGRLTKNVSSGLDEEGNRVYFTKMTFGSANANESYKGYALNPVFNKDGGYVEKNIKISLSTNDGSVIYYTLDGSFPTTKSNKYTHEITVDKTTVIKAISYRNGYLPSEIVSRTFIVEREHDLAIISISADYSSFYGDKGIISNYKQNVNKQVSFEFYESDGTLGTSFMADAKLSGMDSRNQPQKSISIYLRKDYGLKSVTYPFFKEYENTTYSSFLLRNAGEDPKRIRIMDAVLTRTLKGQMDIDMQDYRPVVVYINGEYYGMYNLREKLNGDYVETNYGIDKEDIDFIKYASAQKGTTANYNSLINYINTHDLANKEAYEYVKSQVDIQELCNYWIAESYYGNTDLGNIRYWKANNGKWRFMLYDLDWSMWSSTVSFGYPVINKGIPAVTYLFSSINLSRKLYRNPEYKDMYLKTLAYHLKNTFNPERMNKIVDDLAAEIENEMPYHIKRWGSEYYGMSSINAWKSNIKLFKSVIERRYIYVLSKLKSEFNLTDAEYDKYFKELEQ